MSPSPKSDKARRSSSEWEFESTQAHNDNHHRRPQLNETVSSRHSGVPGPINRITNNIGNVLSEHQLYPLHVNAVIERQVQRQEGIEPSKEQDLAVIYNFSGLNNFELLDVVFMRHAEPSVVKEKDCVMRWLSKVGRSESLKVHARSSRSSSRVGVRQGNQLINSTHGQGTRDCAYTGAWTFDTTASEAMQEDDLNLEYSDSRLLLEKDM